MHAFSSRSARTLALSGLLVGAILTAPFQVVTSRPASISVRQIGEALMGPHVASLLVVGVVLTVALVGAIVIASPDRGEEEDPR